mmetsp:Transcript_15877/g.25186  ORF Transcript_15877/g.25186 Transcript_15877/m.25186 type:complete len:93 (+) Transcript_15877:88-366(+)
MQRYSRLMYSVARPMMAPQMIRPITQFQPMSVYQHSQRSFTRRGYLEDTETYIGMIAPFDDQLVSKKMAFAGFFLLPMYLVPFVCLIAYMFR